jgi:LEA14-like dessication related protein
MIRREFLGMTVLSLALAGCAGGGLGGRTLEPPEVRLADIQFRGAGLLEQRLGLVLRLTNPNEVDLPLDGLRVKLEVDGEPFASGTSNENVTIPALGEETVTVEAISSTADVLGGLTGIAGLNDLEYRLTGTAFLRNSDRRLPIEQEGAIRRSRFAP